MTSDVLDDIDPETPLGWLRDYIRSNDRAPLTRQRALDRLRMVVAQRAERALYIEGYDEVLMGPKYSQPTARQWLHRYIAGDCEAPKAINEHAHEVVENAIKQARAEGYKEGRGDRPLRIPTWEEMNPAGVVKGWTYLTSEAWRDDGTGTTVVLVAPTDRMQREIVSYVEPKHEGHVFDLLAMGSAPDKRGLLEASLRKEWKRPDAASDSTCQQIAKTLPVAKDALEDENEERLEALEDEVSTLATKLARLRDLINTPHTDDWMAAVPLEAAHQIERWGTSHDAGKAPQDWFWLLGYLGGKALHSAIQGDVVKAQHHTISAGAALLNWHRALTGESTAMRPGINPPE